MRMPILKKELKDIMKTSKKFVLPIVFIFFGILSPLTVKFIPELLKGMVGSEMAIKQMGTSFDQFFKNANQTILIVLVFLIMSIVSEEYNSGTMVLTFSKPTSRIEFLLAKFISRILLVLVSLILGLSFCMLYSYILFGGFDISGILLGSLLFFIYSIFLIAAGVFFSTVTKNAAISALCIFGVFLLPAILNIFGENVYRFSPSGLLIYDSVIFKQSVNSGNLMASIVVTIAIAVLFISGAISSLKRQEI